MLTAMTILAAIGDITRFPTAKKAGGLCRAGHPCPRQRHDPFQRPDHQGGQQRSAPRHGERRQPCRGAPSPLEEGVGTAGTSPGPFQGHRGDRPQAPGGSLACAQQSKWRTVLQTRVTWPVRSFGYAYRVGVRNLPDEQSALAFTREQLDRLGIGKDLQEIPWGSKRFKLPPSKLLLEKE